MGSDFPHAEGLADPAEFAGLLDGLTARSSARSSGITRPSCSAPPDPGGTTPRNPRVPAAAPAVVSRGREGPAGPSRAVPSRGDQAPMDRPPSTVTTEPVM